MPEAILDWRSALGRSDKQSIRWLYTQWNSEIDVQSTDYPRGMDSHEWGRRRSKITKGFQERKGKSKGTDVGWNKSRPAATVRFLSSQHFSGVKGHLMCLHFQNPKQHMEPGPWWKWEKSVALVLCFQRGEKTGFLEDPGRLNWRWLQPAKNSQRWPKEN